MEFFLCFSFIYFFHQQPSVSREVTRYMEPGHWFISLYNDDGDEQEITFYAAVADDMTQNCPNGCSGNGQCLLGHCQCNPGFGGDDCSESKCCFDFNPYSLSSHPCSKQMSNVNENEREKAEKFSSSVSFSFIILTLQCHVRWFSCISQESGNEKNHRRKDLMNVLVPKQKGMLAIQRYQCVCVTSNIHKSKMFNEPRIMHMVYFFRVHLAMFSKFECPMYDTRRKSEHLPKRERKKNSNNNIPLPTTTKRRRQINLFIVLISLDMSLCPNV